MSKENYYDEMEYEYKRQGDLEKIKAFVALVLISTLATLVANSVVAIRIVNTVAATGLVGTRMEMIASVVDLMMVGVWIPIMTYTFATLMYIKFYNVINNNVDECIEKLYD